MEKKIEIAKDFMKRVNDHLHGAKIKDLKKTKNNYIAIGVSSKGDEFMLTMAVRTRLVQTLIVGLSPTLTVLDSCFWIREKKFDSFIWIKEKKYESIISTEDYGNEITDILMQIENL